MLQLANQKKDSKHPAALFLRQEAIKRQQAEVEVRQRTRAADMEMRRLAAEERIAKVRLETAKEEGKAAAAEAKDKLEQAKNARAQAQVAKTKAQKENQELAMHFASVLCGQCSEYLVKNGIALKKELDLLGIETKLKDSANKTVAAPRFLDDSDCKAYKDVTRPLAVGAKHTLARGRYFASLEFSWRLFGKKGEFGTFNDIPFLLDRLIDKTLPRYNALLGKRYPVKDLLDSCGKNVDKAYLEANWRYSRLVGQKLFPPGLHKWPPPVGWMDRITRRAVEGPHVTASTIATSSSSSSSGSKALPEHGLHEPVSTMTPSEPSSESSMMTLHSKWAADAVP